MGEEYKKGFDLEEFGATLVVNGLMRIVGFLMRLVIILIGSIVFLCVVVIGLASFVVWAALPFLSVFLFAKGLIIIL